MFGFGPRYNYETFTREMMDPEKHHAAFDRAPEPGDDAPDFEARTLEGDRVRVSDFQGEKNVVLTFGSVTCPMTAGSIRGMNKLFDQYSGEDVQFLFVYVREAHPGEDIPAHRDWEDKLAAAELLRDAEHVEMPILVDDVRGSAHRKYGKLPNPTFLIDKSGRVAFRCLWTQPQVVARALAELLERQEDRGVDHVIVGDGEDRSVPVSYAMLHAYRAMERGGPRALADFRAALGLPGSLAIAASRVAEPIAANAGKLAVATALTGAVLAGGLYAGAQLRRQRMRRSQEPYRYPSVPGERTAMTGTDYEPVGI